ncbi:MAG TPA: hypothetical protein VM889_00780 [Candidatus Thermoplasmatota archaeon]|nr:hypothetical protein [Candidatus Thermoplasmatota archaeon]
MTKRLLVLPLALAVVLAGCIGAGSEPVAPGTTGPSKPTLPTPPVANGTENLTVLESKESFTLTLAHTRLASVSLTTGSKNCLDISFDQNATFVGGSAVFTWTSADQFSQKLEARFYDSTNASKPTAKVVGPSPITLEIPAADFTNRSSPRVLIQAPVGENAVIRDLRVNLDLVLLYASTEDPIYATIVCSQNA